MLYLNNCCPIFFFINVLLFLRKNIIYVFKCKSTNQIKICITCSNLISTRVVLTRSKLTFWRQNIMIITHEYFFCDQARKQWVAIHIVRISVGYSHHIVIINCSPSPLKPICQIKPILSWMVIEYDFKVVSNIPTHYLIWKDTRHGLNQG